MGSFFYSSISAIYCPLIQCKALIPSAHHLTFPYVFCFYLCIVIVCSVTVLMGIVKVMSMADRRGREGEEDYLSNCNQLCFSGDRAMRPKNR